MFNSHLSLIAMNIEVLVRPFPSPVYFQSRIKGTILIFISSSALWISVEEGVRLDSWELQARICQFWFPTKICGTILFGVLDFVTSRTKSKFEEKKLHNPKKHSKYYSHCLPLRGFILVHEAFANCGTDLCCRLLPRMVQYMSNIHIRRNLN